MKRCLLLVVLQLGAAWIAFGQTRIYGALNPSSGEAKTGGYYSINADGTGFIEKEFDPNPIDGSLPLGEILKGSDGRLYGTAEQGGDFGKGVLYSVKTDGTDYKIVHYFGSVTDDGSNPNGKIVQLATGEIIGSTLVGGPDNRGTIYKIKTDGTGYQVLTSFNGSTTGGLPYGGVMLASNGKIYGTLSTGGNGTAGGVYTINTNGTGFSFMLKFNTGGGVPNAGLIEASDGLLYGTNLLDETSSPKQGSIFKVAKDGSGYSVVHLFSNGTGKNPQSDVMEGPDGFLYGSCYGDDSNDIVYRVNKDGAGFSVVHDFIGTGINQLGVELIQGLDGLLYGMHGSGLYRMKTDGKAFEKLVTFDTDGHSPNASLTVIGETFYGTFAQGGSSFLGVVFSFTEQGGLKHLADFGIHKQKGSYVSGPLTKTKSGKMIGTCELGGANDSGVMYSMDGSMSYTKLLDFPHLYDMTYYKGGLVQAPDNTLLSTGRGNGEEGEFIFSVKEDGTGFKKIFDFIPANGASLNPLMMGSDGFVYGTSNYGGAHGVGNLFRIKPDGTGFKVLHEFNMDNEGGAPGQLMLASNGYLYGTTSQYGTNELGTIFRIKTDGTGFQVLRQQDALNTIWYPFTEYKGALYNAAISGGNFNNGAVFRMNLDGSAFTILHSFDFPDGTEPQGGVSIDAAGNIYGTTSNHGTFDHGTIFHMKNDGTGFNVVHHFSRGLPVHQLLLVNSDGKQNQVVSFDPLPDKLTGDEPFELTATASSGLPVNFTSNNPDVATISGNTVTIKGAGTVTITASQAGNSNYDAASAQQSLTVYMITPAENGPGVSSAVTAYPNPVTNIVNLQYRSAPKNSGSITVQVLSSAGNILQVIKPEQVSDDQLRLDLADLATGFYILKISGLQMPIKVVKQ